MILREFENLFAWIFGFSNVRDNFSPISGYVESWWPSLAVNIELIGYLFSRAFAFYVLDKTPKIH